MPRSRRTALPQPTADRWVDADGRPIAEEDRGLAYDLGTLVSRRRTLGLFGALGATALVAACSGTPAAVTVEDPRLDRMSLRTIPESSRTSTPLEPSPG